MGEKYYYNKDKSKTYVLVQNHLLCKLNKNLIDSNLVYEWNRQLDNEIVLYKALYDCPDGPYFVRYAVDFYKNFTKIEEPKPKSISECTDEEIYDFENCSPTYEEWVESAKRLGYGDDYYDYQLMRGDYDYTR